MKSCQPTTASCDPPHEPIAALDAEGCILGLLMLAAGTDDESDVWDALGDLGDEHFYSDANARIFVAACEASLDDDVSPDAVAIAGRLRETRRLKQVGGAAYLAELMDMASTMGRLELVGEYACAVRDAHERRTFAAACANAAALVRCGGTVADARRMLEEVAP